MSNMRIMPVRYGNDIGLRQLRYFAAVAEELHFGRAAARLGMAQPPLTQQIQKLERSLGCALFLRQPRGAKLTEAGAALLEEARRILASVDDALERTRRAGRGETGRLTVAAPPSVMLTRLPSVIRRYRERYPEVQFTLREASTAAIGAGLESGGVDIGFLRESAPAGGAIEFHFQEGLMAALPAAHPLARRPRLSLRDLARAPFVLFPRGLGEAFYDRLIGLCAEAGFTPRVVQEATQWQSVVTFVETGMGVSIAPASVAKFRRAGVVYRPLKGLSTTVNVCSQRGAKTATGEAFVRLARSVLVE